MEVTFDNSELTPHQLDLADRIEGELQRRARYARQSAPDNGNGPSILFSIETRDAQLAVSFELYQDSFHIYANEAEVRILLPSAVAYGAWVESVLSAITQLLGQALRIRVNRPTFLWWLSPEGSIYLTDGKTGHWAGNVGFGLGTEHVHEDWYVPP